MATLATPHTAGRKQNPVSLADALARSLAWPVTSGEARNWLMRVSRPTAHRLLLVIDGLDPADSGTRREIEDLSALILSRTSRTIPARPKADSAKATSNRSWSFAQGHFRRASPFASPLWPELPWAFAWPDAVRERCANAHARTCHYIPSWTMGGTMG